MSDSAFSQENLVVFKLGQIESTLEAIQKQLSRNDERDELERTQVRLRLDGHDDEIKELQKHKNYFAGVMLVIGVALMAAKELVFKWLNFH